MKYAIVTSGGKQYKVSEGSVLEVDRLDTEAGKDFVFENVLLLAEDGQFQLGQPHVEGVVVTAKVLDQTKGDKIRVSQFKAKARHRRVIGFRSSLTKLEVSSIVSKGKAKAAEKKEEAAA